MNKRRRSWRFSPGAASIFLFFLFAPFWLALLQLLTDEDALSDKVLLVAILAVLALVVWFSSLRPIVKNKYWRMPRSWYEAAFALCALYVLYALLIFVTGYTPTKYGSRPIPREEGVLWLWWALVPLTIGLVAYLYAKRRKA